MKFHVPRMVLFGLFAFAAVSSASATQMKTSTPVFATEVTPFKRLSRLPATLGRPWPVWPASSQDRCLPMTTDTGMTAVGTIVETIGAETTGAEIIGVESKPAEKPNVVIGSATRIGPCGTATRTITATIVAKQQA